jgi:hypothetical protein
MRLVDPVAMRQIGTRVLPIEFRIIGNLQPSYPLSADLQNTLHVTWSQGQVGEGADLVPGTDYLLVIGVHLTSYPASTKAVEFGYSVGAHHYRQQTNNSFQIIDAKRCP